MALTSAETNRMRFTKTGRGYARREVDRFRRQISGALLAIERNLGEPTGLTASDIETVTFSWVIGGYDYEEVDQFLERAARVLRVFESVNNAPQDRPVETPMITSTEVAEADFTVVFRGYNMAAVDRFTERVAEALASHERGEPTILADANEVSRKLFDVSMRGYAEQQVDEILDRAAATLRRFEDRSRRRII